MKPLREGVSPSLVSVKSSTTTSARHALADKVFQKDVRFDVSDTDRYGRLIGKIWLGNRDINREMVHEGHAWAYRQYMTDKSLLEDEVAAKQQGIGLWSIAGPVAPWEWRHGERLKSAQRRH